MVLDSVEHSDDEEENGDDGDNDEHSSLMHENETESLSTKSNGWFLLRTL